MRHALVIGGSALVALAIEQRLREAGFALVDLVHDRADALHLAGTDRFDLAIVLPGATGHPQQELLSLAAALDAPLLVAGPDPFPALTSIEQRVAPALPSPMPARAILELAA